MSAKKTKKTKKPQKVTKATKTASQVKQSALDMKIVALILAKPGISDCDIAEACGVHRSTVKKRLSTPLVQDMIEKNSEEAVDIMKGAQREAAHRLIQIMRHPSADIALKACKEIVKGVLSEKHEHTGKDGDPIEVIDYRGKIAERLKISNDNGK